MHNNLDCLHRFDLWTEPWIRVEHGDGHVVELGIGDVLKNAHQYRALCASSPLANVGIHRFLTAILQFIFMPKCASDLKEIWRLRELPPQKVDAFADQFGQRFDLFSPEMPFYQSAEVPEVPEKGMNIKSVANITTDIPSGTENTHYRHGGEKGQLFCPICLAECLVCLPAFSSSGGAGIKPSINGVPPIYVIPCGETLLQSLLWSLILPDYQPEVRSRADDNVWWVRSPKIPRSCISNEVGYLHSLTFQPRRVRLYPETVATKCTRCGRQTKIGVRQMVFDMGESREKESSPWMDPFVAYKISDTKPPIPIRPVEGKALWREYSSLFSKVPEQENKKAKQEKTIRPQVLTQISNLTEGELDLLPIRCIGLRTDMKAKIFEWVDSGFEIPTILMQHEDIAYKIQKALEFARSCAGTISSVFRTHFGGGSAKSERYAQLRAEMISSFWADLANPFRQLTFSMRDLSMIDKAYEEWVEIVIKVGMSAFSDAAGSVGNNGDMLRKRYSGEQQCRNFLYAAKNKELNHE